MQLRTKLEKTCVTRDDILDFFKLLKEREGEYKNIHLQENSKWDRFRLLFKWRSSPGEGEKNFWHTGTYQKAVKLLKEAYLAKPASSLSANKQLEAAAFIDYVRGNAPAHPLKTSSRDYLGKNPGK